MQCGEVVAIDVSVFVAVASPLLHVAIDGGFGALLVVQTRLKVLQVLQIASDARFARVRPARHSGQENKQDN